MRTFICWLLSKLKEPAALGFLGAICLLMGCDKVDGDSMMSILKIAIPIDIVLSLWAAVFTYKNFDEVFSRSSRWRNSYVEKLDYASNIVFLFYLRVSLHSHSFWELLA
jgi:hypothetical protein